MNTQINAILDEARDSLSSYCMNECKAQCCRKGKLLLLKKEETSLVVGKESTIKKAIRDSTLEKQDSGNFHFDFDKYGPCRHLDTKKNLCKVYKDPNRPKICFDYPLFKVGNYIIPAGNCPGVVNGKLDTFLKKMNDLGFYIMK